MHTKRLLVVSGAMVTPALAVRSTGLILFAVLVACVWLMSYLMHDVRLVQQPDRLDRAQRSVRQASRRPQEPARLGSQG